MKTKRTRKGPSEGEMVPAGVAMTEAPVVPLTTSEVHAVAMTTAVHAGGWTKTALLAGASTTTGVQGGVVTTTVLGVVSTTIAVPDVVSMTTVRGVDSTTTVRDAVSTTTVVPGEASTMTAALAEVWMTSGDQGAALMMTGAPEEEEMMREVAGGAWTMGAVVAMTPNPGNPQADLVSRQCLVVASCSGVRQLKHDMFLT